MTEVSVRISGNCSGVGQTSGLPVHGVSDSVFLLASKRRARGPANWQTGGPMSLGFEPIPFGYSMRGHCRTGRRKDRWFCNPKGIVSSSPGLPSPRGYPGLASVRFSTPTGLCLLSTTGPQPRWPTALVFPRVARASQPWASGRNPFGIHLKFPPGMGSIPSGIGPPVCRFTESLTPCFCWRRNAGPEARPTGRPEVCPTLGPEQLQYP